MKLKKDTVVEWNGKSKTLVAGVDYRNLPKDVLAQLPKAKPKPKAKK